MGGPILGDIIVRTKRILIEGGSFLDQEGIEHLMRQAIEKDSPDKAIISRHEPNTENGYVFPFNDISESFRATRDIIEEKNKYLSQENGTLFDIRIGSLLSPLQSAFNYLEPVSSNKIDLMASYISMLLHGFKEMGGVSLFVYPEGNNSAQSLMGNAVLAIMSRQLTAVETMHLPFINAVEKASTAIQRGIDNIICLNMDMIKFADSGLYEESVFEMMSTIKNNVK